MGACWIFFAGTCPKGDDPLTVPASSNGQVWEVELTLDEDSDAADIVAAEFHLAIETLDGETVLTRPIAWDASEEEFEQALLYTNVIKSIGETVTYVSDDTVVSFTFTLTEPLRVNDIRVHWDNECIVEGCFPKRVAMNPANIIASATTSVTAPDTKAESDVCSNRGLCDNSNGICTCFTGYYGPACEYQTVLV